MENLGRLLLMLGFGLVILGGLVMVLGRFLPNLPTIRMQAGSMTCLFPIGLSILLSVVGTIILNVILRIWR